MGPVSEIGISCAWHMKVSGAARMVVACGTAAIMEASGRRIHLLSTASAAAAAASCSAATASPPGAAPSLPGQAQLPALMALTTVPAQTSPQSAAQLCSRDELLVAGDVDGQLHVWSMQPMEHVVRVDGPGLLAAAAAAGSIAPAAPPTPQFCDPLLLSRQGSMARNSSVLHMGGSAVAITHVAACTQLLAAASCSHVAVYTRSGRALFLLPHHATSASAARSRSNRDSQPANSPITGLAWAGSDVLLVATGHTISSWRVVAPASCQEQTVGDGGDAALAPRKEWGLMRGPELLLGSGATHDSTNETSSADPGLRGEDEAAQLSHLSVSSDGCWLAALAATTEHGYVWDLSLCSWKPVVLQAGTSCATVAIDMPAAAADAPTTPCALLIAAHVLRAPAGCGASWVGWDTSSGMVLMAAGDQILAWHPSSQSCGTPHAAILLEGFDAGGKDMTATAPIVTSVCCSCDGLLAGASDNGQVLVWDLSQLMAARPGTSLYGAAWARLPRGMQLNMRTLLAWAGPNILLAATASGDVVCHGVTRGQPDAGPLARLSGSGTPGRAHVGGAVAAVGLRTRVLMRSSHSGALTPGSTGDRMCGSGHSLSTRRASDLLARAIASSVHLSQSGSGPASSRGPPSCSLDGCSLDGSRPNSPAVSRPSSPVPSSPHNRHAAKSTGATARSIPSAACGPSSVPAVSGTSAGLSDPMPGASGLRRAPYRLRSGGGSSTTSTTMMPASALSVMHLRAHAQLGDSSLSLAAPTSVKSVASSQSKVLAHTFTYQQYSTLVAGSCSSTDSGAVCSSSGSNATTIAACSDAASTVPGIGAGSTRAVRRLAARTRMQLQVQHAQQGQSRCVTPGSTRSSGTATTVESAPLPTRTVKGTGVFLPCVEDTAADAQPAEEDESGNALGKGAALPRALRHSPCSAPVSSAQEAAVTQTDSLLPTLITAASHRSLHQSPISAPARGEAEWARPTPSKRSGDGSAVMDDAIPVAGSARLSGSGTSTPSYQYGVSRRSSVTGGGLTLAALAEYDTPSATLRAESSAPLMSEEGGSGVSSGSRSHKDSGGGHAHGTRTARSGRYRRQVSAGSPHSSPAGSVTSLAAGPAASTTSLLGPVTPLERPPQRRSASGHSSGTTHHLPSRLSLSGYAADLPGPSPRSASAAVPGPRSSASGQGQVAVGMAACPTGSGSYYPAGEPSAMPVFYPTVMVPVALDPAIAYAAGMTQPVAFAMPQAYHVTYMHPMHAYGSPVVQHMAYPYAYAPQMAVAGPDAEATADAANKQQQGQERQDHPAC